MLVVLYLQISLDLPFIYLHPWNTVKSSLFLLAVKEEITSVVLGLPMQCLW